MGSADVNPGSVQTDPLPDGQLDRAAEAGVPFQAATSRPEERQHLDVPDMRALVAEMRQVIEGQSRASVVEVSEALANKVQGARDALEHSADPVSQAANSLIELIDRLLRQAFPPDHSLTWIRANFPDVSSLTYEDGGGATRATKYGQALCFAYAGRPVDQRSSFNEIAAAGLVAARSRLQKLKHADVGSDAEREQLVGLLAAVEAYLVLTIRMSWALSPDGELERLRARFTAAA